MQTRELDSAAGATPVAPVASTASPPQSGRPAETSTESDSAPADPLDGDPLDGKPADEDPGAPVDETQLEIVRSGRPHDEPMTLSAYDDDPSTAWAPEADSDATWLWLDLGIERRLRNVRWLATGSGAIEVSLSSDRERWINVDRVDAVTGWQGIDLREDARYVRLTLIPGAEGELPAIAEAAVYGPDQVVGVSAEQKASDDGEKKPTRAPQGDKGASSQQKADKQGSASGGGGRKDKGSKGRVHVSTEPGETRCSGNRERCESRQGEVSVEEDCATDDSCTIDVQADGGKAVCDASGGDETKTDDGEDKRGGRGGSCEAVADGGTVTIGDVNP
jgi:hypothetical protein